LRTRIQYMRICLTGGIACGKSLFARHLKDFGVDSVDADDLVHELVPAEERARLAPVLFADPAARKAHEARLWPQIRMRLNALVGADHRAARPVIAVVPLVYEAGWETDFDFIACLASTPENQLARLMATRGLSERDARARLAAQMPVAEKAARADYVIENNGTAEELREKAKAFAKRFLTGEAAPSPLHNA